MKITIKTRKQQRSWSALLSQHWQYAPWTSGRWWTSSPIKRRKPLNLIGMSMRCWQKSLIFFLVSIWFCCNQIKLFGVVLNLLKSNLLKIQNKLSLRINIQNDYLYADVFRTKFYIICERFSLSNFRLIFRIDKSIVKVKIKSS